MAVLRLRLLWPPIWLLLLQVCHSSKPPCATETERYSDPAVLVPTSYEESGSACQQRCQEKLICNYFTFDAASVPTGACWLYVDPLTKAVAINVVSGPKVCPEELGAAAAVEEANATTAVSTTQEATTTAAATTEEPTTTTVATTTEEPATTTVATTTEEATTSAANTSNEAAPEGGIVSRCEDTLDAPCPEEWKTGPGGYFCVSTGGCRPVLEGPWPLEDCQDQCSIGEVDVPGGGTLEAPFDCYEDLDYVSHWSSVKRQWCCENSPVAPMVCQGDSRDIAECGDNAGPSCPPEWHTGPMGGYYCTAGPADGGCQASSEGPFAMESCQVQCCIGHCGSHSATNPAIWDCHRNLDRWEFWPEEKKRFCCKHDAAAKAVCSHYSEEEESPAAPPSCSGDAAGNCPDSWLSGDSGGYYCMGVDDPAHGGCRPASEGPYPTEDCQEQCSIGQTAVDGHHPAPVFWDCQRHLHEWTWWPEAKKMYCCQAGEIHPAFCQEYVDHDHVWGGISQCPSNLDTQCPDDWHTGASGGYYCQGPGSAIGACRAAADEPFPLEDCKEQCAIGHVSVQGHHPKPDIWNCIYGLDHWMHWPEEKKIWCCAHSPHARAVCGYYAASHASASCDAHTAGGVPCDFPFFWQGEQHHSCYIETNKFGGEPWCVTVDGSWAACDCGQAPGGHTQITHVTHVHPGHWHHAAEGQQPPYVCTEEEEGKAWSNTKRQWCCQQSEQCNETEQTASAPFDCLADLPYWEGDWSLQKKSWCWDTDEDVSADMFDCDKGLANAERGWSQEKKTWCCQEKQKGCGKFFDCDLNLETWETSWNATKKKWCWDHEHKGYSKPYNCQDGLADFVESWPNEKKVWCCENEHLGCGDSFDCETDFENWEAAWTTPQKHFCCQAQQKACYDCAAGYANWERGWSAAKKVYCCEKEEKGCHSCLQVDEMESWSVEHREYCCSQHNVACHDCSGDVHSFGLVKEAWCCQNEGVCVNTTTPAPIPCPDAGVGKDDPEYCNSPIGTWTDEKKDFCCTHYGRGCPGLAYDCTIDAKIWQYAWSKTKKAWCCLHKHVGCYPHYDCDTAATSWSPEKQIWCCHHQQKGCEMYDCYGSPKLWTQPHKDWCCREHGQGCSDLTPFNCHADEGQNIYWSPEKKDWCCTHLKIGCVVSGLVVLGPMHEHHDQVEFGGHLTGGCARRCQWDGQDHSCGERIKYAASHRFPNHKHACTAAVNMVAGECDFCGQCSVERSGCYVYWHAEAHQKVTHHVVTTVTHLGSSYNCHAGSEAAWAQEQRDYCCWKERVGCPKPIVPAASYDCDTGFDKWETAWEAVRKEWCCKHRSRACARYQCDLGLHDFGQLWGPPKKVWCCKHENKGCVAGFQWFDCTEKAEHWESLWTAEKKGWCCAHKKMGCPGWQWHPGGVTHVTHTTYTTQHHNEVGGRWVVGWHHGSSSGGQIIGGGAVHGQIIGGGAHIEHHSTLQFDCHAALDNWEDAWSHDKKLWCWTNKRLGFSKLFNCHAGQADQWSGKKESWCCTHLQMCHHPGVPAPAEHAAHLRVSSPWGAAGEFVRPIQAFYDCTSALRNWEDAWSPGKKQWCWSHQRKGGAEPYECHDNKAGLWSAPKKDWCCEHKKEVCPERRLSESVPALYA